MAYGNNNDRQARQRADDRAEQRAALRWNRDQRVTDYSNVGAFAVDQTWREGTDNPQAREECESPSLRIIANPVLRKVA
jgi:hypothetical protein